jgi:coenzyme Q-binding protein COQ10
MHTHSEILHSPFTPQQLFALVVDIEKYPEFLPWCRAARVTKREGDHFFGELIINFSHLSERYTSRVTPIAPMDGEGSIEVEAINGPFKTLANHWRFVPAEGGGTDIHFALEFEFKSRILNSLIGSLFGRAVEKMSGAFLTRAEQLYGSVK